ncbi:MAG TPA: response regulator [Terriglobales bacterium]|jgi:CheY-like chemotaxis protein|nr:response regulator [Terriglobales bacterium]
MPARVLLIDDSRFLRTALEKMLSKRGFEVCVAGDGEEGLRLVRESAKFDLILLDLFLPKMTGYEILKRLRANPATDTVPVLILSGIARQKDLEELRSQGATDCLPKETLDLRAVVASAEACLMQQQLQACI